MFLKGFMRKMSVFLICVAVLCAGAGCGEVNKEEGVGDKKEGLSWEDFGKEGSGGIFLLEEGDEGMSMSELLGVEDEEYLVVFTDPYCSACIEYEKVLKEYREDRGRRVKLYVVNTYEDEKSVEYLKEVQGENWAVPFTVLFRHKEKAGEFVGDMSLEELMEFAEKE